MSELKKSVSTPHLHIRTEDSYLLDSHKRLLEASAISPDVIAARGYRSETVKARLEELGFGRNQQQVPCLVIPVWGTDGKVAFH